MTFSRNTIQIPHPPTHWYRAGRVMDRATSGGFDSSVMGDPCIVWDDEIDAYRMFYFAQRHENGKEVNCNALAVAHADVHGRPGAWEKRGPLEYINPEALSGDTHKPFVVMDPYQPNRAAELDGGYVLLTVTYRDGRKVIQRARAASLAGPWEVQAEPVVGLGGPGAFDEYHADSVTAFHFAERRETLIFYKGYPATPQADQPHSPYGSSNAAAVLKDGETVATKLGKVLSPSPDAAHWTSGLIAALQLLPAKDGGWWGLINASPTPPLSVHEEPVMREPAPSMGGWAYTPERWPVKSWRVMGEPIEWIDALPEDAVESGEGVNLWRHHALVTLNRELRVYYNSGPYGQEQLFCKYTTELANTNAGANDRRAKTARPLVKIGAKAPPRVARPVRKA